MSIALVGSAASNGISTSASINLPSGYASGDLLLAFLSIASGTPTTPSGWTLQSSEAVGAGFAYVYSRVSNGTEGTALAVSLSTSTQWTTLALAYSGTSASAPVNAVGAANTTTAVASPVSAAVSSITTSVANTLLLYVVAPGGSESTAQTTSLTAPTGFGSPLYGNAQAYVYQQAAASMAQAASGGTGTITGTYSVSGNSIWAAFLLALAPVESSTGTGAATTTAPVVAAAASATAVGAAAATIKASVASGVASATAKGVGAAVTKAVLAAALASVTAHGVGSALTTGPQAVGYAGNGSATGVGTAITSTPRGAGTATASSTATGAPHPSAPIAHGTASATASAYGHTFTSTPIAAAVAAGTAPLFPTFPTLPGMGWPVKLTPNFVTVTHQAAAGNSYRTSLAQAPLHTIEAPINFLLQSDYGRLKTFFETQAGNFGPFYFTVPNGATYTCTFPDGLEFEQFMYQIYKTKTLKLKEVR